MNKNTMMDVATQYNCLRYGLCNLNIYSVTKYLKSQNH